MKNLSLLLMLIINSCTMGQEQEINLDGKIAIENSNGVSGSLYYPATKRKVALRYDAQIHYSGLHWASTTDSFVGIEYHKNKIGRTVRGNVVRFDLNGQVIDTVFQAKEYELAGYAYLSANDRRLLFTLEVDHYNPANPLDQVNQQASIVVMDFKKKEIVKKIDNIGLSSSIVFNESPWFANETRFIYDIRGDRKITVEGEGLIKDNNLAGVYMYDLNTDSLALLIEGGQNGVVSPVADQVAYIKDKKIWIYDLAKKTRRAVYTPAENEKVMHIHWTPNGEYIYLTNYNKYDLGVFVNGKKLIRADDGKEVSFNKNGPGSGSYTWR